MTHQTGALAGNCTTNKEFYNNLNSSSCTESRTLYPKSDKSAFLAFTNFDFTIMKLDEINVIVR
ncbi:hypothetical protein MP477_11140 [Chryseobacterium sp. WG23]|uniref:hypothetical protein n=1 Tax=Chryseobacterium sp. WG23 TaxID=2926910 RepID=UPI00211DD12C|nr:hypothetical protein [Chryseobacterium sp. WG23]MCQ9635512.1 hypothetical protein [Chryseobacterium sp. WG23]